MHFKVHIWNGSKDHHKSWLFITFITSYLIATQVLQFIGGEQIRIPFHPITFEFHWHVQHFLCSLFVYLPYYLHKTLNLGNLERMFLPSLWIWHKHSTSNFPASCRVRPPTIFCYLYFSWILINIDISPQDTLGEYYSLLLVLNQSCVNWSSWTSNDEIVKIKKIASVTVPGTSGRTIDLKEAVPPRASQFIFMERLWLWMQTSSMDAKSWMPATLTATSNWASRLNSNPEAKVRLRSIGDPGVTVATGPSEISHPKDKTNSVLPNTRFKLFQF